MDYYIIETTFLGPTNTKGARIRCVTGAYKKFYRYNYANDAHDWAAEEFAQAIFTTNFIMKRAISAHNKGNYYIVMKER